MSNPWFRLYAEFAHDPKVQMMTEQMQRRYIMLLCMRCSNSLVTLHETEVAFHMRISDADLAETKGLFMQKGFIDSAWNLLNWEKRQFSSDSSATRVAKHRALQKQKQDVTCNVTETLLQRKCNVLDTDTDTDTYKDKPPKSPNGDDLFEQFWLAYPSKVAKDAARKAFDKRKVTQSMLAEMLSAIAVQSKSSKWLAEKGKYIPNPATWLNGGRWMDGTTPDTGIKGWFVEAGFDNPDIANNMGCYPHNAHQFHNGQLDKVAA